MTTPTFEEILNTPVDDLPDELQTPAGTWRFRCKAITNKEDGILLTLEPVNACEDVDAGELAEWDEEKEEDVVVFHRLRGTPRAAAAQLKSLVRILGVAKPKDLIDSEFYGTLVYDVSRKDPTRKFARVKGFQALDASE